MNEEYLQTSSTARGARLRVIKNESASPYIYET
jgi:hypothetical protein